VATIRKARPERRQASVSSAARDDNNFNHNNHDFRSIEVLFVRW
jgi:hypothetical protein